MNNSIKKSVNKTIKQIIIPLVIFITLVVLIKTNKLDFFNNAVYNAIKELRNGTLTVIIKIVTHFGNALILIIASIALFILPSTKLKIGVYSVLSVGGAGILNQILKRILKINRPDVFTLIKETGYSFPSGHAMLSSAFFITLILTIINKIKNKTVKTITNILIVLLILIIGLSRIYLGVHFTTDIIGAWLLGYVSAIVIYNFINLLKDKNLIN